MLVVTSVYQMAAHHVCNHLASECLVDYVLQEYMPYCDKLRGRNDYRWLPILGGKGKQGDIRHGVLTLLGDKRAHS